MLLQLIAVKKYIQYSINTYDQIRWALIPRRSTGELAFG
jgi:hypothetical protein